MTLHQLTKDFVTHFRILRDKAGDLTAGLRTVSVEDSHLCAVIRELYLDWSVLTELKAWGRQRDLPDVYPHFAKDSGEFTEKWKDELSSLLHQKYDQIFADEALLDWFIRLSERCVEFEVLRVRHPYDSAVLRIERVTRDLKRPDLADLFCDNPELLERLPGLGGFRINFDALREAEEDVLRQAQAAAERRDAEAAKPECERAISRLRASMWDPDLRDEDDRGWFFDPEFHSAAELIRQLADYCRDRAGEHPVWSRWEGAFSWLRGTVGLDLAKIERRWKIIAPIPVPPIVSERERVDDPESLFGYLDQVRRAYMIGADLAALAMCRTVTEILFRRYYNTDEEAKLGLLIQRTQRNQRYAFTRQLNIVDKLNIAKGVEEANQILHSSREDIQNKRRTQELVEGWTRALAELIRQAPSATRR